MAFRVKLLKPDDPPNSFPDPEQARATLGYPDGLIAIGGDLSSARLLYAYENGIFPWFNEDQPIMWWSPDPRAILLPDNFHMSRSLKRRLRRETWSYSLNQRFGEVISACATDRGEHGTWITRDMIQAYENLHRLGFAHSLEVWRDGKLAGGVYGVRLGGVFFGESMFSRMTDGSKIALAALADISRAEGIVMIDCQLESQHLRTLGMREVSRGEFMRLLASAGKTAQALPEWRFEPRDTSALLAS